ncbi:MAG: hypothetical protein ACRDHU_02110 [Actinomycetota bacterium]
MRRTLLILALALAATACGKADADRSRPEPQGPPPTSDGATAVGGTNSTDPATMLTGPTGEAAEAEEAEAEEADAGASTDDLEVFGYATSDEAALAADLSAVAGTLASLEADLRAQDVDGARADAQTLLDQANALETGARSAEKRQRPLEPQDAGLVAAREHAIAAFGLTADYAASVTAIADLVMAGSFGELVSAAEDAAELAGTSDDLAQSYTDLNVELAGWAEANPAEAARAVARYGG